jgi:intracellular sulfur oxidation DsrE/DsrF family protein
MKTKRKRVPKQNNEVLISKYVYDKAQRGEKITNADIITHIENESGIVVCDSQIRNIINDLRNNDVILLLLADTKGFFIAQSEKEVKAWIETHEKKIESMKMTLRSIKRQLKTKKSICEYLGEKF